MGPDLGVSLLIIHDGRMDGEEWLHTLVRGSNRVIRVVGALGTADDMLVASTDLGAGRDGDDIVVLVLDVLVAGKLGIVDVLDGVVGRGSPNTVEKTLVNAVDGDLLENGVGRGQGHEAENGSDLHFGRGWCC